MRAIDADALLEDFRARAVKAREWKENALNCGNEEAVIRADATIAFLTEVKLTIENAPTIERPKGKWIGSNGVKYTFPNSNNICSNCKIHSNKFYIFCPNCGAQMER